jgi:hypothetical protein
MRQLFGIILGLTLLVSNANALDIGVGVKAGTLGAGVDLSVALTQTINARVSLTAVNIDDLNETITVGDAGNTGDIDATMNFDFGASSLLFDWYVFDGTFHLTAGMMKNNGKVAFSGALLTGVMVNGQALDPGDISGDISGSISLGDSYRPYLGIGWGRKADDNSGLSLSVEIGVALLDPKAELNAQVIAGVNFIGGTAQDDLNATLIDAENDVNNDLSLLEAWPVLSIGLNYAF